MIRYAIRRLILAIPTVLVISFIAFLIVYLAPGDAALVILGPEATHEQIEVIRRELGLDQPIHVQYYRWITRLLGGNWGRSWVTGANVLEELIPRYLSTLMLTTLSMTVAAVFGVSLGIISGVRYGSIIDRVCQGITTMVISMPTFLIGLMLIWIFAIELRWLPAMGKTIILPAIALSMRTGCWLLSTTRDGMKSVMDKEYIRAARAKGASERRVLFYHGLKNSLIPILSVLALQFGVCLGGTVIIETIFVWPGLGQHMVQAILQRNAPVLQGGILLFGISYVVVNLITDLAYTLVDPRIRY